MDVFSNAGAIERLMMNKEQIKSILQKWIDNDLLTLEELDTLSDSQLQVFKEKLHWYKSGMSCDYGWYWLVFNSLMDVGVAERLSHALAASIDEFDVNTNQ